MEPRPVSASRSVLVQAMGPSEANSIGSVHGGVVMRLVDR